MTRLRAPHELPGNRPILPFAPSPDLLRQAGAAATAVALEKAVDLRDRCSAAKRAVREAEPALWAVEFALEALWPLPRTPTSPPEVEKQRELQ